MTRQNPPSPNATNTLNFGEAEQLHIDWTACDGRGLCVELLPELLARDPWGYPVPHQPGPIQVPENLTRHAEKAAALCPFLALRLQQSAPPGPEHRQR